MFPSDAHRLLASTGLVAVCLLAACSGGAPSAAPANTTAPAPVSSSVASPVSAPVSSSVASPAPSPSILPGSPVVLPSPSPSVSVQSTRGEGAAADGSPTPFTAFFTQASAGFLPIYAAQDAGIFTNNGLDVSLQQADSPATGLAALLSGQAQVGQIGATNVLGPIAGGADLSIVAIVIPTHNFVIEARSGIQSLQDLVGGNAGTTGPGAQDDVALRVALQRAGIDPSQVHILTFNTTQNACAAVLNGEIDACLASPPQTLQAEAAGTHPILDMAAEHIPNAGQASIVNRSYAASHRQAVQAYVDSLVEAVVRMKADKPFTLSVIQNHLGTTDPQQLEATYDFYVGEVFPTLPYPNPDLFHDALPLLAQQNSQLEGFDVTKVVDQSFVHSAADRGVDQQTGS